jgi:hypothetical protein
LAPIKAQSYISQNQLTVVLNVNNYYYANGVYIVYNPYPGYSIMDIMGRALFDRQRKYDYAHNVLSTEFQKLKKLELINYDNLAILNNTRKTIIEYAAENYSKVDFSIYNNFVSWLDYFTAIYKIPSVKNEISLLNAVNSELSRIKRQNPDNFYKSDRYKELGQALSSLQTINKDSISTISWKYGLF